MTTEFPECPKCEQKALYAEESDEPVHDCPDCSCHEDEPEKTLKCAACGHSPSGMTIEVEDELVEQAERAMADWDAENPSTTFRQHWRAKIRREKEKVARLMEGRW